MTIIRISVHEFQAEFETEKEAEEFKHKLEFNHEGVNYIVDHMYPSIDAPSYHSYFLVVHEKHP